MKYTVIIILAVICLLSCDKDSSYKCCLRIPFSQFAVKISNLAGDDLLNPETEGTLNTDQIRTFCLIDGVKEENFYGGNTYDAWNYITIDTIDGRYFIEFQANKYVDTEYSITYIQWNADDTDTVRCKLYKNDYGTGVSSLWYNDSLAMNSEIIERTGNPFIEIVK